MKRYRVFPLDFDTRATVLSQQVTDEWAPRVKHLWNENKKQIEESLIKEFGALGASDKINNFIALGPAPLSIIAFHNKFFHQARNSFVIGAFYPALTAVCALGERVLNHLIIKLRDDFTSTLVYNKVSRKKSFDNWDPAINTLVSWQVLLPSVATAFHELKNIRNRALHFNPSLDLNARELALSALNNFTAIINGQFSVLGTQPWFIAGYQESYIQKTWEDKPFIKRVVLPNNCALVGPKHKIMRMFPVVIDDNFNYEDREVSDAEFIELRKSARAVVPQEFTPPHDSPDASG